MTKFNTPNFCYSQRLAMKISGYLGLGIAFMLLVGNLQATGLQQADTSMLTAQQVSASMPAPLSVSKIDFRRGENGSGRLTISFDGEGALPDMRNQSDSVIVDISNAILPEQWRRIINVTDYATPVVRIDPRIFSQGTRLVLSTTGAFESLAYQAGREYIVEVSPKSNLTAPGTGVVTASTLAQAANRLSDTPSYTGKPVTFNFQDVPVRTVLQLIAEESGLNVVASDTVQGNITLRLINVPWDQALDVVLRAKGLDKRRDNTVMWVAPQPELAKFEQDRLVAGNKLDKLTDLRTEYIQINYHNAEKIVDILTGAKGIGSSESSNNDDSDSSFLSSRGRLVPDARTNTLMVSDIPKKIAQIHELIAVIDRPVDQVLIEGRIVIATDTFARELGARFGVDGAKDRFITGGSLEATNYRAGRIDEAPTIDQVLNVNSPLSAANRGGSFALTILGNYVNWNVELSAMQAEGRGEVVSNPRVITANQREASIKQGQEVGYVTVTGGGSGGAATPNVEFKEVMLELKVTPSITDDGRVFLDMNIKKDEVERYIELAGYGEVPAISRREVNTAVLVEDGQTVVVGGVYEFTDRSSIRKVPFLGDIPFLGALFKTRSRSKNKAELLVFVTPKIMRVARRPSVVE